MSKGKRRCVLCDTDKDSGKIYSFYELLRELEIEGRYAHPLCVMDARAARKAKIRKYGAEAC